MVIQLLISSEHWQSKPVSAIHHVKNRKYWHKHLLCLESHSNTKTKNQSSTLSHPRHLAACSGYMEQSRNGSWPRPVFHLDPIYPLPSYAFSMWIHGDFLHSVLCTERFTKSRIFYTLWRVWICCTHHFLPLSIWDSKGARDWLLLARASKGKLLQCYKQRSFLNSLHTLPFQLLNFCACSPAMTLGWFQKILSEPPQGSGKQKLMLNDYF